MTEKGLVEIEAVAEIPRVSREIIKIKVPEEWVEYRLRGYTLKEMLGMTLRELAEKVLTSRARRTILRSLEKGLNHMKEVLLEKCIRAQKGEYKRQIKTHERDMLILPIMVGLTINVYR